jgi:hypothetical protein
MRARDAVLSVGAFGPGTAFALVGTFLLSAVTALALCPKLNEQRAALAATTVGHAPECAPEAAG